MKDYLFRNSYGFLTVYTYEDEVIMEYRGNMGNTVFPHIEECFEGIYGYGKFPQVLPHCKITGTPDYLWTAKIFRKKWKKYNIA